MKLLKKIAPLAITALMAITPLAVAANIATWDDVFTASSTAVVVGSGTIGTQDMAAALTVARAVGIDTTVPSSVTGESYLFEKSSDKLNLGEGLDDIRPTLTSDQLPTLLADGTYVDDNNDEFEYTQKITMAAGTMDLTHFADKDYDDDKTPTLGIKVADGAEVFDYTLDFSEVPHFSDDLVSTTITFLGKDYYISDQTANVDLTLLDSGESATVMEGDTKIVGGKTIGISYVGDTPEVALLVDGVETNTLEEGDVYKLAGSDTYIGIKDIRYTAKETGKSSVVLSVGKGKIYLKDNSTVEVNDEEVDGLTVDLDVNGDGLNGFTLTWAVDDDMFVTETSSVTLPAFESVKFMMTGMTFPSSSEEIVADANGDSEAQITVPIQSGEQTIALLADTDGDGTFDVIGNEDEELLATTLGASATLDFNATAGDTYFVATYDDGDKDSESYYLSVDFSEDSGTDYVTLTDETGTKSCKKAAGNTCTFGNVELDITDVDSELEEVSIDAGTDVYFDRLYTENGLRIWLPQDEAAAQKGFMNGTTGFGGLAWTLVTVEADEDGTLGSGDMINMTYGFAGSDEDLVSITGVVADWASGASMLEGDDDKYIGYVESPLATKVDYDKSGDQDTATVTYYGAEVYGNVYIAGSGSSGGEETSWTAVKDSEVTSGYAKNIIAIGGTAVNKVARSMLGLSETTPVYGSDSAWRTATGVDAVGKGILWMKTSPYNTGKYALLVAGYEGADTEKTANFLTLKSSTLAKEKAVIDTVNNVEATA